MDTRLHALALPAGDPSSLKDPELAAAEILETMIERCRLTLRLPLEPRRDRR
ncbi:hypothetical protein FHT70_000373 [Rhizobium sp. BK049]|uniref:hypothetical protein n=1 Tax=Rhizobium sp. BK049 TaxID=2587095 RepID=UPI00160E0BCE|nr:hypothetical protein [Rhizobium sp. BK049]MBB3350472.1 hypothetical protein [Rhizobium sp. BK049]